MQVKQPTHPLRPTCCGIKKESASTRHLCFKSIRVQRVLDIL